jgi:tyrosyl-tRNA synthetase
MAKRFEEFAPINQQMDAIRQDTSEIIPEEDLVRKLERSRASGQPLRVKQGFDPTRPDLHIGHAVSMRKLHTFQELGHEVIFVVGDYTARVGDPSGRSEARPKLSPAEIDANAKTRRKSTRTRRPTPTRSAASSTSRRCVSNTTRNGSHRSTWRASSS